MLLGSPRLALRAGHDVDNDIAAVLSALPAGAMRQPQCTTFALREILSEKRVVRAPLGGLRSVPAHSDYHMNDNIRDL